MADNVPFAEGASIVQLGSHVLELIRSDEVKALDALEQYVEALGAWQTALAGRMQRSEPLSEDEQVLVRAVSDQHDAIVAAAGELKGDTEESMRNLNNWVKGIRGYADALLPKRISTIKPKQG
jgi:hypothetical protein